MDIEAINQVSMKIILYAGDARTFNMEALSDVLVDDYDKAKANLDSARKKIQEAHSEHTKVIQYSIDKEIPYSILFAHAQDTLMSIMGEINIGEKLIQIAQHLEQKVKGC